MHSRRYTYMFSLGDSNAPATVKAPLFICTFWLETTFGISGTVLHWFASYLEGREQSVKVDNVLSSPSPLQFGVPQDSVLGPVLFTLYSQPLSYLICRHECDYHKYADDTQLSKGAPPDNFGLFSVISRPALKVLLTGCTATSSN